MLPPAFAASSPLGGNDSKSPIRVTADNMIYEPDKNTVVFSGNVEVVRDDFRMWSARLTMYMKERKDAAGGEKCRKCAKRRIGRPRRHESRRS